MKTILHLRHQRAFSLIEIMIASSISAVASIAMVTIFITCSRFISQGFTETRLTANASLAHEQISRDLNMAYRNTAILATNRPVISNSNQTVSYAVPFNGGSQQRRFRFDTGASELHYEVNNGTPASPSWADVFNKPFLRDVDNFRVYSENTEGFISYMIRMEVDMGLDGIKRYSLVGRALPRNL